MHKRADKVAETIHEMVSRLLLKGVKDPRIGFVTITGVKVTDDLHLATVYYTVVGDEAERKASRQGLESARGFLRRELGRHLKMRYIPDLLFSYDESIDYGNRIDALLRELHEGEERDG